MIVVFNCPQCRRTLRADDYFSGKKIQCRNCKTVLFVPGAPPVRDGHTPDAEIASPAPEKVRFDQETDAPSLTTSDTSAQPDASYGIASLCLAFFSVFVLSPTVAAAIIAPMPIFGMRYGLGCGFLAGALCTVSCYLFGRHGYNFAVKAEECGTGLGYAAAGKLINKFLMKTYASSIVLLILAGIITLIFAKQVDPMQDALKIMDQLKGLGH